MLVCYYHHKEFGGIVFEKFFNKIFETSVKDKNVLDLGCGEGNDLEILNKEGAIIHGLDINEEVHDPMAEKIHNRLYPGFILIKARKKQQ